MVNSTQKQEFIIVDDIDDAEWTRIQLQQPIVKEGMFSFPDTPIERKWFLDEADNVAQVRAFIEALRKGSTSTKIRDIPNLQGDVSADILVTAKEMGYFAIALSALSGWAVVENSWETALLISTIGILSGMVFILMNGAIGRESNSTDS